MGLHLIRQRGDPPDGLDKKEDFVVKRCWKSALLFCIMSFLLAGTALADIGPKPQLAVKVVNGPEEHYYLDLLEESQEGVHRHDNLSAEERGSLDHQMLEALERAVPEGWTACLSQGTPVVPMFGNLTGENGLHTFSYRGVPETYRVLIVTQSGETWISETLERKALQTSLTVDWAAKTAKAPPIWLAYALQILSTLIPTLIIEGLILLAFRFEWKRNWRPFLLVNLITQGALAIFSGVLVVREGFSFMWILLFVPAEVVIALVEALLYRRFLRGQSKNRAFAYGLTANAVSAVLGWFLMESVWRLVVTIS